MAHCKSNLNFNTRILILTFFSLFIVTKFFICLSGELLTLSFILKGQITTSCDLAFLLLDKYQHAPHAQDVHVCWLCLSSVVIFLQWVLLLLDLCIVLDAKREACTTKIKTCVFFVILSQIKIYFPLVLHLKTSQQITPPHDLLAHTHTHTHTLTPFPHHFLLSVTDVLQLWSEHCSDV